MTALRLGTLRVSGARLHYQLRGDGPLLLIIMGGGDDADAASGLVGYLAERYTVMTYDRRGLSRSTLDDPEQHPRIETHSEDVHSLLATVSLEPVFVLGISLGALITLDLISRHPAQVHLLVAHEPPLPQLLPDSQRIEAARVQRGLEQGPGGPQWGEVMQKIGVDYTNPEPGVEFPPPTAQMIANGAFFCSRDAPAAHRYEPNLDALRTVAPRIVTAGGERSRDAFPHRSARALADRLGTEFVEFPGDHAGIATRPKAFAAKLTTILNH